MKTKFVVLLLVILSGCASGTCGSFGSTSNWDDKTGQAVWGKC